VDRRRPVGVLAAVGQTTAVLSQGVDDAVALGYRPGRNGLVISLR
jgi:hypothetical protein